MRPVTDFSSAPVSRCAEWRWRAGNIESVSKILYVPHFLWYSQTWVALTYFFISNWTPRNTLLITFVMCYMLLYEYYVLKVSSLFISILNLISSRIFFVRIPSFCYILVFSELGLHNEKSLSFQITHLKRVFFWEDRTNTQLLKRSCFVKHSIWYM